MTIPSFKLMKSRAAERLRASENAGRVTTAFAGATAGLMALSAVVTYGLGLKISQTGGLSNMGLRSVLSTVQSVLPMVVSMIVMCLELGYLAAMLRVSREQYVSRQTLKLGFSRFWVLFRCRILQSLMYSGAGFVAFWVAMQIYLFTPLSQKAQTLLMPYLSDANAVLAVLADEALMMQIVKAMIPMFVLTAVLFLPLAAMLYYSMRMTDYVIIDQPGMGALYAIGESRKMTKGSRMRLFRLDLSFWWWYVISLLTMLVCYGQEILAALGISLSLPKDAGYFLFMGAYLVLQFVTWYFLRSRVEVVYAQAYDALKPRQSSDGVVLGNIFQM